MKVAERFHLSIAMTTRSLAPTTGPLVRVGRLCGRLPVRDRQDCILKRHEDDLELEPGRDRHGQEHVHRECPPEQTFIVSQMYHLVVVETHHRLGAFDQLMHIPASYLVALLER